MKILIVDDNIDIRKLIKRYFRNTEHEIIEASDGELGVEKANEHNPDLILLDVMMPELNGIDVLGKIRANEKLKETPVIMLTAVNEQETIREAAMKGVDSYIVKPFEKTLVMERIFNVLKK